MAHFKVCQSCGITFKWIYWVDTHTEFCNPCFEEMIERLDSFREENGIKDVALSTWLVMKFVKGYPECWPDEAKRWFGKKGEGSEGIGKLKENAGRGR